MIRRSNHQAYDALFLRVGARHPNAQLTRCIIYANWRELFSSTSLFANLRNL